MKKTEPVFFIGNAMVSMLVARLVVVMGGMVLEMLRAYTSVQYPDSIKWIFYVAAAGVFILIFSRQMKKGKRTLKDYYLMSAVVAIVSVLLLLWAMLIFFRPFIIRLITVFEGRFGDVFAFMFMYLVAVASIAAILFLFRLLTRKKSEYIRYIAREVQKISEHGELVHIEEKGEDELAALSRNINQMAVDLNENRCRQALAEKQKNELISNVSHDLRSPLTSVLGYVQLLKENGCKDEEKFREYMEVADRRLKGLNALVDELFELTKLDSPNFAMKPEKLDITEFIKQFGYEMDVILAQNGLNLICAIDDTAFVAWVDGDRIARVMQNLFANVIKYAKKNTDVILESKIKKNSIQIQLSNCVEENADIDTDTMFDRFYKADVSRSDCESSGLGLAIAKKIVELHGGSISAKLDGDVLMITIFFEN